MLYAKSSERWQGAVEGALEREAGHWDPTSLDSLDAFYGPQRVPWLYGICFPHMYNVHNAVLAHCRAVL